MSSNDAAESQCNGYAGDPGASAPRCESYRGHPGRHFIRHDLTAERRATAERIRARLVDVSVHLPVDRDFLERILDEASLP